MSKSIILDQKHAVKTHQMYMAMNIANLKTKLAQKQQAHLLCISLVKSISGRA